MFDKTKPMLLGDIFSNSFNLIGKTLQNNLLLAIIFLIPAGLLYAYGLQSLLSGMVDTAKNSIENGQPDPASIMAMMANGSIFSLAMIVFLFGNLAAFIGIVYNSHKKMLGDDITFEDALRSVFSIRLGKSIGFYILQFLALIGIILASVIVMVILFIGDYLILKIVGVLTLIAAILIIIFLTYMWYFAPIYIIGEGTGVMDSFGKSFMLVKGNWWRTFGILLLISIIIQFGSTLILTPLSFVFMWDFISNMFAQGMAGAGTPPDPEQALSMMSSMGFGLGIISVISTIINVIVSTAFLVVMFFDLKIRKGDFEQEIIEESIQGTPDLPENTEDNIE